MTDVLLDGLDVIAVLQGQHGIGVTHVMKANGRHKRQRIITGNRYYDH